MKEKVVKIGFFKKLWYSITKFEIYPTMATEGSWSAMKYLIMLIVMIAVIMMGCSLYEIKLSIADVADYIQQKIPEFSYSNGTLLLDAEETIVIEEKDNTGIDKIIINTLIITDEEKQILQTNNLVNGINMFFFKDQIILKIQSEGNEVLEQKYSYGDIIFSFVGNDLQQFTKTDFTEYLKNGDMATFYGTYAVAVFASYFVENFVIAIIYSIEIAILGWITTIVLNIKMRFKALFNMSIYSITLSTILMTIYLIVNYFTGFIIKEFQIAYVAIAYIYLAASIFILKDDFMQKMQEVEKIKQEQLKVRNEIKEDRKEENTEKDKEDKKEENESEEPQGSEG